MRKLIAIIFMYIIASNSYFGMVNDKGEKVTDIQEVLREQNLITNEVIQEQTEEIKEQEDIRETQESKSEEKENKIAENKQQEINSNNNKKQQTQEINKTEKQETATKTTTINKATTNTTSQNKSENTVKQETQENLQDYGYTEKEVKVAQKTECVGNNHKMSSGNTDKWFETKAQADKYYDEEIEKWGKMWEHDEITKEEYLKKCPSGYEVWTCPQCQKWTINFYYR